MFSRERKDGVKQYEIELSDRVAEKLEELKKSWHLLAEAVISACIEFSYQCNYDPNTTIVSKGETSSTDLIFSTLEKALLQGHNIEVPDLGIIIRAPRDQNEQPSQARVERLEEQVRQANKIIEEAFSATAQNALSVMLPTDTANQIIDYLKKYGVYDK